MGVTYNAAAVIGCKVPKSKIWVNKKTRSYQHVIHGHVNFCSECGKNCGQRK